jgi:hypothetical protein
MLTGLPNQSVRGELLVEKGLRHRRRVAAVVSDHAPASRLATDSAIF